MLPPMQDTHQTRPERVPFKHPVRVETMDEPKRVIRTLADNVSCDGIFLRMPEPLTEGTRLLVSLEARGAPHLLAEGEVRWGTRQAACAGCGVLFTRYAHPRSKALLAHLVDTHAHQRARRVAGRPTRWRRPITTLVVALLCGGLLALPVALRGDAPAAVAAVAAQPVSVPAPRVMPAPVVEVAQVTSPGPEAPAELPRLEAPPELSAAKQAKTRRVLSSARAGAAKPSLAQALQGAPPPEKVAPRSRFGSELTIAGTSRGSLPLPSGAAKALAWEVSPHALRFTVEGQVLSAFVLNNPARAVIDVRGSRPQQSQTLKLAAPHVKSLRVGELADGTRLVIDLELAPSSARQVGDALVLQF